MPKNIVTGNSLPPIDIAGLSSSSGPALNSHNLKVGIMAGLGALIVIPGIYNITVRTAFWRQGLWSALKTYVVEWSRLWEVEPEHDHQYWKTKYDIEKEWADKYQSANAAWVAFWDKEKEEKKTLESMLSNLKTTAEEITNKNKQLEQEVTSLQSNKKQQHSTKLNSYRYSTNKTPFDKRMQTLQQENDRLKNTVTRLNATRENERQECKEKYASLSKKYETLEEKYNVLSTKCAKMSHQKTVAKPLLALFTPKDNEQ